mgnify:CR=1 FL=1
MPPKNIALCIVATKRYKIFLEPLLESIKKHFLTQHKITLFIFSDSADHNGWLDLDGHDVHWTQIEHLPYPLPTLFRYKYFLRKENELSSFDYIFYCDADMRFVGTVGEEMLGQGITAIQHPGAGSNDPKVFWDLTELLEWGCFETNPKSLAYIPPEKQNKYWCGGIQGGSSEKYLEVIKLLDENIDEDLRQNIVAAYHDETHWNRYLANNEPDITLPFWYCFPECVGWENKQVACKKDVYVPEDQEIKMLCLDKDLHGGHYLFRGDVGDKNVFYKNTNYTVKKKDIIKIDGQESVVLSTGERVFWQDIGQQWVNYKEIER